MMIGYFQTGGKPFEFLDKYEADAARAALI
jgi:hypothetical protein